MVPLVPTSLMSCIVCTTAMELGFIFTEQYPWIEFLSETLEEMNAMANKSLAGQGPPLDFGLLFIDDSSTSPATTYNISLVYNESDPFSLVLLSHTVLQSICILASMLWFLFFWIHFLHSKDQTALHTNARVLEVSYPLLSYTADTNSLFQLFGMFLVRCLLVLTGCRSTFASIRLCIYDPTVCCAPRIREGQENQVLSHTGRLITLPADSISEFAVS